MTPQKVEIIAPNFSLQKKIGAPAKYMPSRCLQNADEALQSLAGSFESVRTSFIDTLKSGQSTCEDIYAVSHEFRGLAGSFQSKPQGKIADALCRYVDAARDANLPPDGSVVAILKNALLACETVSATDPYSSEKISEAACDAVFRKIEDIKKRCESAA